MPQPVARFSNRSTMLSWRVGAACCWLLALSPKAQTAPTGGGSGHAECVRATAIAAVTLHQPVSLAQAVESVEELAPSPEVVQAPAPARRATRSYRPITALTADATLPAGLLPEQVDPKQGNIDPSSIPETEDPRFYDGWANQSYDWAATAMCHGPLYFEQVNLERYGYQCHPALQPFVSGAHFFLTVPTLPYQMTVHPPRECIYTLGHYRPGDRVPWRRSCLPWDARAAAVEATVAVGLVFLIP